MMYTCQSCYENPPYLLFHTFLLLSKVVSSCDQMVLSGQTFLDASRSFSGTLKELATHFNDQETVSVSQEEESFFLAVTTEIMRQLTSSLRALGEISF